MKITVVIPTYNEAENIQKLVPILLSLPIPDLSVLVVDDNSRDGTGDILESMRSTYEGRLDVLHRPGKMGLGTAYVQGFGLALKAGADAVAQMDADFSHPPEKLVELADALKECDIAIGSRYIKGGSLDENWPIWRKWLSAFANFYARTILGMRLRDCTGGFRLYRKEALEKMQFERVRSNGYIFQVETAYLASRVGCTFKEIPIYFADRRWGQSKMSLRIQIEAAIRVWQVLFLYRNLK